MISLVAFLGNYGKEYEKTRHNIAWLFESSFPFSAELIWQCKFKGRYAIITSQRLMQVMQFYHITSYSSEKSSGDLSLKYYFLKPETYMNLSGESIKELMQFYKIKPEEVLIVHDEIELPIGTVSLKWSGGLGGHNGLRSIKNVLGTSDFWRLRFGIGRPEHGEVADYVLNPFTSGQTDMLSQIFSGSLSLFVSVLLSSDPQYLLKEWGKKKLTV